jgi:DNA-binding PadR family transcriptional regulator
MHDDDPKWDRQWRRMEAMARRGMRRFGNINLNMGAGDWAGGLRAGKMLASGDLRLVALYLIEQQPRHGYDLIKAIEDMSKGFYSPSPGVIYPALTYLEEAGFAISSVDGNKKLYAITDEGRAHLGENREAVESTLNFLGKAGTRMREWGERMASPDFPFSQEQARKFRDMQHGGWPFHGPEAASPAPEAGQPAAPGDLEELRKAIKKAAKRAETEGEAEKRRVAIILAEALKAIRAGRRDPDADIAL